MLEAQLGLLVRDAECAEHLRLAFHLMNPYRAAAKFNAVQHNVVCLCANLTRGGRQLVHIFVHRAGERMVNGDKALLLLVPVKKRELHNPQELHERGVFDKSRLVRNCQTQTPHSLGGGAPLVCDDKNQISRDGLHRGERGGDLGLGHELGGRSVHLSAVLDLKPNKPLGAEEADRRREIVQNLAACGSGISLDVDCADDAAVVQRSSKCLELSA